jgi:hypothetical protein
VYSGVRAAIRDLTEPRRAQRSGAHRPDALHWRCRCLQGHREFALVAPAPVTVVAEPRSIAMTSSTETGNVTGTKDKDYDLIWFTEACLDNALRLETYIQDAEREGDSELMDLFRRAQADSRKGAEQAKKLLARRLSG